MKTENPQVASQPVFVMGSVKTGKNNEERITSLEIAELAGKPHADVLKAIRKMEEPWKKVAEGNFS